jgi:2-polyprenyl-6-hydroxyphenyl methylase/3-demethylubiquinone-9 3-methyltransferase
LGALSVLAIDIDENSVAATRDTLSRYATSRVWDAKVVSAFDATPETVGAFDVVYSWGVLHHTGDMWRAIRCASALVKPNGLFALAIYTKTRMCGFLRYEKSFYTRAPKYLQALAWAVYVTAYLLGKAALGKTQFDLSRNTELNVE